MDVTREQVIGYRVAAQGLHRTARTVTELAVLDIGVQEAMGHSASVIFAARVRDAAVARDVVVGPGEDLAYAWTLRGAPHVHRRADLDRIARAIFPLSEADAATRLNESGPAVKKAGIPALDQFETAVRVMRDVVRKPTEKGAASTAATAELPKAMRHPCRSCKTSHISDSAMRSASPVAGLELEPGTSPPVLLRRPRAKRPTKADPKAVASFALDFLRLLGPATSADFAGYLGARSADVKALWPDDELAEVSVDGTKAWLPADRLDALRDAPDAELVRLLGAFDPYLQARDRTLIVPDKAVHKALWPTLGRPGVLFVDGEVLGTWRTKATKNKLTVTVESFAPIPAAAWKRTQDEAERVALVRGYDDVTLTR